MACPSGHAVARGRSNLEVCPPSNASRQSNQDCWRLPTPVPSSSIRLPYTVIVAHNQASLPAQASRTKPDKIKLLPVSTDTNAEQWPPPLG